MKHKHNETALHPKKGKEMKINVASVQIGFVTTKDKVVDGSVVKDSDGNTVKVSLPRSEWIPWANLYSHKNLEIKSLLSIKEELEAGKLVKVGSEEKKFKILQDVALQVSDLLDPSKPSIPLEFELDTRTIRDQNGKNVESLVLTGLKGTK